MQRTVVLPYKHFREASATTTSSLQSHRVELLYGSDSLTFSARVTADIETLQDL